MPDANIKVLPKATLLKILKNSIGSKIFNSLVVHYQDSGEIKDILEDGTKSCAFFVTSILALLGLIDKPHTTVKTALEKLSANGWRESGNIQPGDVLVWEKKRFSDGSENEHIGFALSAKEAVSTSYIKKKIIKHGADFNGKRRLTAIFRYPFAE